MTEPKKMLKFDHHSTGDWDFDNTSWTLDTSIYVSPPSSVRFTALNKALVKTIHVPIAATKEGQIICQVYFTSNLYANMQFAFRYQDTNNWYGVMITNSGGKYIMRNKAGLISMLKTSDIGATPYVWHKYRVTWWNDFVGLVIRVEEFIGGVWVKLMDDGYDTENLWKDIGGRVGLGYFSPITYYNMACYDDTEIYGSG